jgi:hypothetical protein
MFLFVLAFYTKFEALSVSPYIDTMGPTIKITNKTIPSVTIRVNSALVNPINSKNAFIINSFQILPVGITLAHMPTNEDGYQPKRLLYKVIMAIGVHLRVCV